MLSWNVPSKFYISLIVQYCNRLLSCTSQLWTFVKRISGMFRRQPWTWFSTKSSRFVNQRLTRLGKSSSLMMKMMVLFIGKAKVIRCCCNFIDLYCVPLHSRVWQCFIEIRFSQPTLKWRSKRELLTQRCFWKSIWPLKEMITIFCCLKGRCALGVQHTGRPVVHAGNLPIGVQSSFLLLKKLFLICPIKIQMII